MFKWAAFLGLAGLAAATCLMVWTGWAQVAQALLQSGWGIASITAFHGLSLIISSASWRVLVPGKRRLSLRLFIYFMWVRAAVNNLMPVARIGGEIASVRLMITHGMRKSLAIGSTVVELTISITAVFSFVLVGTFLFSLRASDQNILRQLAWGLAASLPLIAFLIAVQRIGLFGLLMRLCQGAIREKWTKMLGNGAQFDRAVQTIYRRHDRVVACYLMQLVAWSLGSVEIWLSLGFLGHALSLSECLMFEALIQGSVSAAFAIPGALGVQEGGFLLFGGLLGIPHETAAALALMRRCRDLLFYAPALAVWQWHEGRQLLRRAAVRRAPT